MPVSKDIGVKESNCGWQSSSRLNIHKFLVLSDPYTSCFTGKKGVVYGEEGAGIMASAPSAAGPPRLHP